MGFDRDTRPMFDIDFATFKQKVYTTFSIDLRNYKETQLKRRIENLMARNEIPGYLAYYQLLKKDHRLFQEFVDHLTINVTEFFRDPAMFKILEEKVLPELLRERSLLKIWSAACSNGAEPYSVAMILEDLTPGRRHHIEATDIDQRILGVARRGVYTPDLLRNISPARRAKYFREVDGLYVLNEKVKKRVVFSCHDLLKDPYGKGYDLIMCRNVQIYFTKDAQHRINKQFSEALRPGGVLFIGSSETILNYRELCLEKGAPSFYRKVGDSSGKGGCLVGTVR
ncbi:MAG: protein-glutamate O-methyltransferase CheR [Bacillota bacterium]|jgi:chemotaxis protein methyltransferase CheR